MADTYRAWLRGAGKWQDISVIDLRPPDATGKILQMAGLRTLGEIDAMEGLELLKREGIGVGVLRRARRAIRACKAADRQRKSAAAAVRPARPVSGP